MPTPIRNINISNESSVHMTITWEYGDANNVLIVASQKDDIVLPIQGKTYNSSPEYGKEEFESGYFTVFNNNTKRTFTLYNLKENTKYKLFFFEYTLDINDNPIYESFVTDTYIQTANADYLNQIAFETIDEHTKDGIGNVNIQIESPQGNVIFEDYTDYKGRLRTYRLPIGRYKVIATHDDYREQTIMSIFNKNLIDNNSSFKTLRTTTHTVYMKNKVRDGLSGQDTTFTNINL